MYKGKPPAESIQQVLQKKNEGIKTIWKPLFWVLHLLAFIGYQTTRPFETFPKYSHNILSSIKRTLYLTKQVLPNKTTTKHSGFKAKTERNRFSFWNLALSKLSTKKLQILLAKIPKLFFNFVRIVLTVSRSGRVFIQYLKASLLFFRNLQSVFLLKKSVKREKNHASPKRRTKNFSWSSLKYKFFVAGLSFGLGIFFTLLFIVFPVAAYNWYEELPRPELLAQKGFNKSTKILDRTGRLLYEIYVDKKYDAVPLSRVPDTVINATIAIEDDAFYTHVGFRPLSILRAAKSSVLNESLQGGSTITQQLIKNVLLTPEQTLSRKLKEVVIAVLVEKKYSKNEILELYLNNIPYGGTAYGIQAASQKYFGKDVWDLDLAESSLLAGLPSAPSVYSPVQGGLENAKTRQKQVLDRMVTLGYVTALEASEAYEKELVFAPQEEYIRAPHFVAYVRDNLYTLYGKRTVDFEGLTVKTSLDLDLQGMVQEVLRLEVEKNGDLLKFSNAAAVVLDSQSGEVLAYVGSVDYFAENSGKYDVLTALRQPGSSIKPVTYALALENGYTPASIIDDSPITFQSYGQKYTPKNYDNKFHGKVTLRAALANSYNIPAVKLIDKLGVDNMVRLAVQMGISNWIPGDGSYGLSITLGGKEVRLLDLTNLYATFARSGKYTDTKMLLSVQDAHGSELYTPANNKQYQALSPETAYIITNILSDNQARTPAFGFRSKLVIPNRTVAVKTGTTNNIKDNITIGYTPSYTVGVWVGNNDNAPMHPRLSSGLTGAAPIWNSIMTKLLESLPADVFEVPEGIVLKGDRSCGYSEVFNKKYNIPDKVCIIKNSDDKNVDD